MIYLQRREKAGYKMSDQVMLFVFGLILLIKGGDWFVGGAGAIARRLHLPEILIGATVVSIGTTLPEVMVSATSAVQGIGGIAYGNAIGSVICNTALVAAVTVAVRPSSVDRNSLILPIGFFFLSAIFYAFNAYVFGKFTRGSGIVLLAIFLFYMVVTVLQMKKNPVPESEITARDLQEEIEKSDEGEVRQSLLKSLIYLAVGAALIAIGADLLVDNGTKIAKALGVPETVIALTFVALGTSLPELVTAVTSLAKGHSALSLGNVIGANLFNLVLVTGVSATIAPFAVPADKSLNGINASLIIDIPVMFGVMLLLAVPVLLRGKLYKPQGIALLIVYAGFCLMQFLI